MERGAPVEELTSGASGRIIPVFRNIRRSVPSPASLLRVLLFLHALAMWFLLFIRRRSPISWRSMAASASPRRRAGVGRWSAAAEEEDVLRRRSLADRVEMVPLPEEGGGEVACRCETFLFLGPRRTALYCRSWVPASGDLRWRSCEINRYHYYYYNKAEVLARPVLVRMRKSANVGRGRNFLRGSMLLRGVLDAELGRLVPWAVSGMAILHKGLFGDGRGDPERPLRCPNRLPTWSLGLTWLPPKCRCGRPSGAGLDESDRPIGYPSNLKTQEQAVAPIFSLVLPKFQFKGANRRGIPVSRDPAAMSAKYSDPLVYTRPIRVRTGHEILRISSYLLQNMKSITVPFFVLHGTADRVTDPLASQDLYNVAASRHKDIKLYEGFLHDLLFEPERDEVAGDIINWMLKMLQLQNQ
ncbi:hypothetical protein GW17_00016161 [Ensete ventricosum]|nr:hypothetical protein GW17_00016161 [Ensete ventricosum]